MSTFTHLLREHGRAHPERAALHLVHAGQPDRPVTTGELLRGAAGWAAVLAERGVQPGEVVVLIQRHGIDLVFAYFGTILHGAIPSIMPFLTEKLLPERYRADLSSLVSVTRPAAIVTYAEFEREVRSALKEGDSVRAVILESEAAAPCEPDFDSLGGLQRQPDDVVLLQHSSGTTGLQKGVALSHGAVLRQLESYRQAVRLTGEDVIVSWLPLYHDMGLIAGFLMPILTGVPLVLLSPFEWVRAPARLFQAVSRYRGTLTWLPNFAYNFCAQKVRDRDLAEVDLSSWRAVINCSEPMRWESHRAFYARFAAYGLRESALATCYAMAENVFAVTQGGIDAPVTVDEIDREALQVERVARPAAGSDGAVKMLSAGRPIPGTAVRVVDPDGRDLPERVVGEIALRSHCMLSGYYHRPDATARAFIDGWYLTGDFGYLAGGELYISGRKKDLIIVGGKNIYPQDVEELVMTVAGVHPGRVAAFGVFDDEAGTEEVVVVAELEEGAGEGEEARQAIADEIRRTVTRGSAVALRHVHLVGPGWMVKTSSGKTARGANREKWMKEQ
ncbi:MAG TPA: AMP-binding protein [Anaerolineaceae bacterium]|nr:AMP-binding protein [Anaerolineaceae bacterium]